MVTSRTVVLEEESDRSMYSKEAKGEGGWTLVVRDFTSTPTSIQMIIGEIGRDGFGSFCGALLYTYIERERMGLKCLGVTSPITSVTPRTQV